MAESQSAHRQELEKAVVQGGLAQANRGQNFAFALGALAIISGAILIGFGKDVQGLVAIITALVTLAGVFIYGRRQQERERARKRAEQRAE